MLDRAAVEAEEEELREAAAALPDEQRRDFYREVKGELKDPDTYAVLNWFFVVGLHHFYLRRWGRGMLDVGLFAAGIVLIVAQQPLIGIALILLVAGLELWALVRSQVIVADWNNAIFRRVLGRYQ